MTPLRIAMVLASPFPANHGTPASVKELGTALARAGHYVHFLTYPFGEGELPAEFEVTRTAANLGFRKQMVVGPTWQKPLLDLLMIFAVTRVVLREKIDVIHAHNYEGALIGFAAHLLTRRPLVYHAINTMSDELPAYDFIRPRFVAAALARLLDYWVPRMAGHIIAISEELVEFLRSRKIPEQRIHMIPIGVDLTPFQEGRRPDFREEHGIGDGRVVIYTGILDAFQRIDYLIQAMRVVVDRAPDTLLLLVVNLARPRDVDARREQIRELGLEDHVQFFLNVGFKDVPAFLQEAQVAVVPRPDCPGFPVKMLNYMAARRAQVLFAGSAKGLRDHEHALIVPDHDWRAMGEAILNLFDDPSLRNRLVEQAHRWTETRYAWPTIVRQIEDVYADALGLRADAPVPQVGE